jgi:calcineurin-like phosphoesterase family protein
MFCKFGGIMIYFISDTHFGHKGSLLWNNGRVRPMFGGVTEMDYIMINNWNKTVKSDKDDVWFLGDFAYKCNKNYAESIFRSLNGTKHLVKGNHDYGIATKFKDWASISDINQVDYVDTVTGSKIEIILCHYPMISWRHSNHGSIHLHGHTHGSIQDKNLGVKRFDVSVECINYTPISIEDVVKMANNV